MKKEKTLRQSLFDSGLIEKGDKQAIEAFKVAHQKQYIKSYNAEYRAKTVRKTLTYTEEELAYLSEEAKRRNMKLAPFIKLAAFSYLQSTFVFPDKRRLSDIETMLRHINNSVNQVLPLAYMHQNLKLEDIQELKDQIISLESYMKEKLEHPPTIDIWLQEQINRKGESFLSTLLSEIAKHLLILSS